MSRGKIIEVMARGICPMAMANPKLHGEHQRARHFANDALAALEAAGFAVVPCEPTEAMIEAARETYWDYWREEGDDNWKEHWLETYSAMLAAAKEKP